MMINKRLIATVGESKKYIAANVALQWVSLAANILIMGTFCRVLAGLWTGTPLSLARAAALVLGAVAVRIACGVGASRMAYLSGRAVKLRLRGLIYDKLLRLGASYRERVSTGEVVQVAVEGVEQLETYFGAYLSQFFYAMLAPLTLFAVLFGVNLPAAAVLLVCVPLIPAAIAAVQTWAKKLLSKYWGQYTALGDTFLENLQGLTTLKIYQADGFKNEEMNRESEKFRRITMKVLTMQLNSITIMDLVAYGGAAAGMVLAAVAFRNGHVGLEGALFIMLLAADFFLPMRLLGSYFHIAMNGMAASEKIFRLLDTPEPKPGTRAIGRDVSIRCEDLTFGYEPDRPVLRGVDLSIGQGAFVAIAGESGCGKSTVAGVLTGRNRGWSGRVTVGGVPLDKIAEESLLANVTYVGHQSTLFKGTVGDNLRMGNPKADDAALWQVLEEVRLADFLRSEQGLDTPVAERGANLSGGQCQRLALARAILHDSPVYIFDEATSNIDVESENVIMDRIRAMAGRKTVILISHRLANLEPADRIYVMQNGQVAEAGTHGELLERRGVYARLWNAQQKLENLCEEETQ